MMEQLYIDGISKETFNRAIAYADFFSGFLASNENASRLLIALVSKHYRTFTHSINVCVFGLSLYWQTLYEEKPDLVSDVAVGLLFHDIGKSRINSSILDKPGALTPTEWRIIHRHPVWGYHILKDNGVSQSAALNIVRSHHERLDGQGYPDGLKSPKIPPWVQIAAIADRFAALTTNRPYRMRVSAYRALAELKKENDQGNWVDQALFESFIRMLKNRNSSGEETK
jgi:HD-GYP domain-containing protein (c-di-GMP phosphodiesterase class II)